MGGGGANDFVRPLDDLVAKSRTNNVGVDIAKVSSCDQLVLRKPPKKIQLQI